MAILVLLSTISFTVEKHFCGEVLVDVSVFTQVEKCALEDFKKEQEAITKKSCCRDTIDVFEGQDELIVKTYTDLEFEQQLFIASYIYSYLNPFEGLSKQLIPHQNYSPPNLVEDLIIKDQIFLI